MNKLALFSPDRYEADPAKRIISCPVSFQQENSMPYTVPQFQRDYLEAKTLKEQEMALIRFARSNAAASDSPETFYKMEERLTSIRKKEH